MKMQPGRITLTTALVVLLVSGCEKSGDQANASNNGAEQTTAQDVEKEVQEAMTTSMEYATEKHNEYTDRIAADLTQLGEKIDELNQKAAQAGQDAKAEFQDALAALQEKQRAAERKLEEIRAKAPDAWSDFKTGVDRAMADLRTAYETAKNRFATG